MKKLILLLFFITSIAYSQSNIKDLNCSLFKVGNFKIVDDLSGITNIKRTSKYQIEENKKHNYKIKLVVTWINDCTYQLKPVEDLLNPQNKNLPEMILTCKIIKKTKNGYLQVSTSNVSDLTLKKEVIQVD
ncbi:MULTISPECIES: hypothetical protein [Tenacibaculum]|uniref:DNA topoisomerase IV n=1 Tax=Tenacibaculum aiptasiae TaxID=426481 RepID=A0A7J5ATS0_9FLAO|nr:MULTISPECIES: hypothetical protein [Tenacibaculum]KAB1160340.1 hypothetical protein F7018_00240 [Tenacibaculum aiptasiae]MCF2874906.1 hypothetical protein [Tenacibaculum sp. Cn5-1]MCF2934028.1 hypothetical protein [Tenacibaculum sp. Cn5-34]MCG7510238.1 hypothetical protein [Tenacibaculum sp. Cn5-46]